MPCYRGTDGNPFFVSEVLRHLVRDLRALYQELVEAMGFRSLVGTMSPLPDSVREVIGARVGRLGPEGGEGVVDGGGDRPGLRPRCPGPGHADLR